MRSDILKWPFELISYSTPDTVLRIKTEEYLRNQYVDQIYADSHIFRLNLIHEMCIKKDILPSVLNSFIQSSNVIYGNFQLQIEDMEQNAETQPLHCYFIKILDLIESIIAWLGKLPIRTNKRIFELFPVTNYNFSRMRVILPRLGVGLEKIIDERKIDKKLGRLVSEEFRVLCSNKELSTKDVRYLTRISKALIHEKPFNTLDFVYILCKNNYNSPAFFYYCTHYCDKFIGKKNEMHHQMDRLFVLENRIIELNITKSEAWMSDSADIIDQISGYLAKKRRIVTRTVRSSRLTNLTRKGNSDRMHVNLSVAQFGLLIRLLIIVGVLTNKAVAKTFDFFARHFYTSNTDIISTHSIHRKSIDIDYSTAKKMKALLIEAINWLNKNFHE